MSNVFGKPSISNRSSSHSKASKQVFKTSLPQQRSLPGSSKKRKNIEAPAEDLNADKHSKVFESIDFNKYEAPNVYLEDALCSLMKLDDVLAHDLKPEL